MGDLAKDTAVEPSGRGDGKFRAELSSDWEIWGPMGGYVAACALRAAGVAGAQRWPAAFSCHYLSVAKFAPVDIAVETRRQGRSATSQRVEVSQDGRGVLDAMVWSVADVEGLEHDETTPPDIPGPDGLPGFAELLPGEEPAFPFWRNFDGKPLDFEKEWPPDGPRPAEWREWLKFLPTPAYEDPWEDAARTVILADLPSWPSAHRPHAWQEPPFTAPTLDLNVAFHRPTSGEEWLLCEGMSPVSTRGMFGWTARIWSTSGKLLTSGGGQCLYRRLPT